MLKRGSKTLVSIYIFISCFIFYMLFWSGHHYSIDGVVMFQYAKTLLFDHSFKMNPPVRWGTFEFVIPQWSIGLSLAYTPILAVLSKTIFLEDTSIQKIPYQAGIDYNQDLLYNRPYLYSSFLNPAVTALSAMILYWLCVELGLSNKKASAIALTFGLLSPATVYAKLDFSQPLASLFLLLTFFFLLKGGMKHMKHSILNLSLAGVCMGLAILARSEFMILSPILVASVYFIPEDETSPNKYVPIATLRKLLGFGLPLFAMILLNQGITFLQFGSWLKSGYPLATLVLLDVKHWSIAFIGNLISPGRGIFLFFPMSILSLVGMRKLMEIDRWFAGTLIVFMVGSFLFYPIWRAWDGGISWGPRFLIPMMPYLCLLAYLALPPALGFYYRFAVGILLILGAIATLQGILFNFLSFYGSLGLTADQFEQELYHFSLFMSPLFRGWRGLVHPTNYDIQWLHLGPGTNIQVIFPLFGLVCFMCLIKIWFDFFRSPAK